MHIICVQLPGTHAVVNNAIHLDILFCLWLDGSSRSAAGSIPPINGDFPASHV